MKNKLPKMSMLMIMCHVALLLTACSYLPQGAVLSGSAGESLAAVVSAKDAGQPEYTESGHTLLFRKDGVALSALEPEEGCYAGAYVLSNSYIDYDMKRFDYLTKKNHALSLNSMRLDEEAPAEWLAKVAKAGKTPYITVYPPNDYSVFDVETLEKIVKSFSNLSNYNSDLSIPFFVDFFPQPQSYTKNAGIYTDFYKKARELFRLHVPNAVFVITADSKGVYDFDLYYPGNDYVDWVGISIYHTLYADGELNLRNYMKDLDYFYGMYQYEKPIIISGLAISSYSTVDGQRTSEESAKRLSEIYAKLKNDYTRIKGVIYMDFDNSLGAPETAERDNFSVTQDDIMLDTYTRAITDKHFLSKSISDDGVPSPDGLFKSFYVVMQDENQKYIPKNAVENYVKGGGIDVKMINGEAYYSLEELSKSGIATVETDDDNKRIIIEVKQLYSVTLKDFTS